MTAVMKTLREAREAKGLKLQKVAEHLGISRQTYSKYEKNPELMTVKQAKAACGFIGCEFGDIFFVSEVK